MKKLLMLSIAVLSITGMQAMPRSQFEKVSEQQNRQRKVSNTIHLTLKVKNILKKTETEILKLIDDHAQISIKQGGTVTLPNDGMNYITNSKHAKIESKTKWVEYDSDPSGFDGGMDRSIKEHITVLKINTDAPIEAIIRVYNETPYLHTHNVSYGSKVLYKTYKVVK